MYGKLKTTKQEKKEGTKTVFITTSVENETIDYKKYMNFERSLKFHRSLGGSETVTRNYTPRGYNIVKIISTSPDKQTRYIYEFDFSIEEKN
jgi:hypothetical protein